MIHTAKPQRTALLADIHGNSPALQAVLEDIQRHACTQVFLLGDIINGVDPHGCMDLLRDFSAGLEGGLACIKGNAESYLLTPDLDELPETLEPWNADLIQLMGWIQAHLTEADRDWIRSFSDTLRWNDAILVHDSPVDRLHPQGWHLPSVEPKYQEWFFHSPGIQPEMVEDRWQELLRCMDDWHFQQVYCGHTHVPFLRRFGPKLVCNVGSVGAPLDGDPQAAWVLVEQSSDQDQTVIIQRVGYEIARIHRLIDLTPDYPDFRSPGFQKAYKQWFSTGVHWRAHLKGVMGNQ